MVKLSCVDCLNCKIKISEMILKCKKGHWDYEELNSKEKKEIKLTHYKDFYRVKGTKNDLIRIKKREIFNKANIGKDNICIDYDEILRI